MKKPTKTIMGKRIVPATPSPDKKAKKTVPKVEIEIPASRKGKKMMPQVEIEMASPPSYKCGGKVKKGGMAKVHAGEVVLTKSQAKKKGY